MIDAILSDEIFWLSRVLSAVRTGIACLLVLVGLSQAEICIAFPVFGYVVAATVLSESTLGKSTEDGFFALFGAAQAAVFAMVVLQVIGKESVSLGVCLTCIFASSFIFTCFPRQKAMKKRLALAVTTIIYVTTYINPQTTHPIYFPLKLLATTTLGTVSALIALLFPVPRLSAYQARKKSKLCASLAMDQFRLLVDTFCCSNRREFVALFLKLKLLERAWLSSLEELKQKQVEAAWEPRFFSPVSSHVRKMECMNSCLVGMRMALEEGPLAEEVQNTMKVASSEEHVSQVNELLLSVTDTASAWSDQDRKLKLKRMFYLFTARKFVEEQVSLLTEVKTEPAPPGRDKDHQCSHSCSSCSSCLKSESANPSTTSSRKTFINISTVDNKMTIESLKIALAMTAAVYLGLLYRKDYGYWSTITVALGLFNHKSGLFTSTSLRLQGTGLGTVYGYLVALITHQSVVATIFALLPWLLFTSFMRKSKLLKLTGASSALTSALIILGKRRPGDVQDFAVLRMTQAVLGLSTFMIVEVLICPRRAGQLSHEEFSRNVKRFQDFLQALSDMNEARSCSTCCRKAICHLQQKEEEIRAGNCLQMELTREAKAEPDLWYGPFRRDVYEKLAESQCRMTELLHFLVSASVDMDHTEKESVQVKASVEQQIKMVHDHLLMLQHSLQLSSKGHDWIIADDLENQPVSPARVDKAICSGGFEEVVLHVGESQRGIELAVGTCVFTCHALVQEIMQLQSLVQELLCLFKKTHHWRTYFWRWSGWKNFCIVR